MQPKASQRVCYPADEAREAYSVSEILIDPSTASKPRVIGVNTADKVTLCRVN